MHASDLCFGGVDLLLGILFVIAYLKTPRREPPRTILRAVEDICPCVFLGPRLHNSRLLSLRVPERTRYNRTAHVAETMPPIDNREPPRHWWTRVLTDVHFWVPVAVLIGGLLLWNPFTERDQNLNMPSAVTPGMNCRPELASAQAASLGHPFRFHRGSLARAAEAPTKLVSVGVSPIVISLIMVTGVFLARWSVPAFILGTSSVRADLAARLTHHLGPLAGCLWAVADTMTIFAIRDIGLSIAFPLWNPNSLLAFSGVSFSSMNCARPAGDAIIDYLLLSTRYQFVMFGERRRVFGLPSGKRKRHNVWLGKSLLGENLPNDG